MPDLAEIQQKMTDGVALSDEEKREVMSQTHEEPENVDDSEDIKADAERVQDAEGEGAPAAKTTPEPTPKTEKTEPTKTEPAAAKPADTATTPEATKAGEGTQAEPAKADAKKAEDAGSIGKVERELEKPEGQEDVSELTLRERGLFYSMRRERKARQEAEAERDTLKFQRLKAEQEQAANAEPANDEFLTKEQVAKRVKEAELASELSLRRHLTGMWTREAERVHADLHQVLAAGESLITRNVEHQAKIRDAYEAGENVALVTYDLIMSDPAFVPPAQKADAKPEPKPAEAKPASAEAIKNAKKLQENANKVVTTGSAGGGDAPADEMTADYVRGLSDSQFAALPKAKREKILQQFG